ncbi:sensor histidine kinase [Holophaga foetida]|uniref:sensor histidine kinase n=1 Tax=Holophaga foetida TaxID=35839 RepID=UPI0002471C5C|nr:ATP-binding protein [Holophaga foetida]
MPRTQHELSRALPSPWLAFLLGILGTGLLAKASDPTNQVLGWLMLLGATGWLFWGQRTSRMLIKRLLSVIPVERKDESLFREAPKVWAELERENRELRLLNLREDQLRRTILANLKAGVVVLDSNREVRLSNRAAQSLLGSSSLITLGSPLVGVFREPLCLSNLARAFAGEGAEWDLKRNPKILRVRAFPIDLDPGETYGVLVTLDDITRQEALETTRQKFISNASHELKTPATSIRIAAENLLEGNLVIPEGETSLRIIIRSVERMAMLLNDISELSQIETGATALEPAPILLGGFLEGVLEDVSSQAQARQIRLTSHLEEGLEETTLITDPHRLHQLLDNLLNNAIKFSPEQAEVKLLGARDGEWVSLSVVDQGPGIAETEQSRIFERFYRSPLTRGVPGTGLGLAIVKHLASLMGGEISLKSSLGAGATFTLRLPLAE